MKESIEAYNKLTDLVSEMNSYAVEIIHDLDASDLVQYTQYYTFALISRLLFADHKVNPHETRFFNTIMGIDLAQLNAVNSVTLYTFLKQSDSQISALLHDIPAFIKAAVAVDATMDTTYAEDMINCLKTIGLAAVAADGQSDESELKVLDIIIKPIEVFISESMSSALLSEEQEAADDADIVSNELLIDKNHVNTTGETLQVIDNQIDDTLESVIVELNSLIGLGAVKKDVNSLCNFIRVQSMRRANGLPTPAMSLHLVFSGNPGTGKTTVARLLGRIYRHLGILQKGHLLEVDRSGLVAGYVGQTALKVKDVVKKALDGILFIDEAYSLTSKDQLSDYGKEAIEVLLKNMEDYRDRLIIIVAGYTDKMHDFIKSNPGLESRFNKYIRFEDYDEIELVEIFISMCAKAGVRLTDDGKDKLMEAIGILYASKSENFGNAREIRNLYEKTLQNQANRLMGITNCTKEQLQTIELVDFPG